jgi:hypothetical protein
VPEILEPGSIVGAGGLAARESFRKTLGARPILDEDLVDPKDDGCQKPEEQPLLVCDRDFFGVFLAPTGRDVR